MRLSSLSTILAIALLTFAFCGAGMMCAEQLAHYSILAGSVPVQSLVVSTLFLAFAMFILPASTIANVRQPLPIRRSERAPDIVAQSPLKLAFSDGILNTKVF